MSNAVVVGMVGLYVLGVVLPLGVLIRAVRLLAEVKALAAQAVQQTRTGRQSVDSRPSRNDRANC